MNEQKVPGVENDRLAGAGATGAGGRKEGVVLAAIKRLNKYYPPPQFVNLLQPVECLYIQGGGE